MSVILFLSRCIKNVLVDTSLIYLPYVVMFLMVSTDLEICVHVSKKEIETYTTAGNC